MQRDLSGYLNVGKMSSQEYFPIVNSWMGKKISPWLITCKPWGHVQSVAENAFTLTLTKIIPLCEFIIMVRLEIGMEKRKAVSREKGDIQEKKIGAKRTQQLVEDILSDTVLSSTCSWVSFLHWCKNGSTIVSQLLCVLQFSTKVLGLVAMTSIN